MAVRLLALPVRAMTGPHWTGETDDPRLDPRAYSAIHFHEDSLSDAGWSPSFAFTVPDDVPSGVYSARLTTAITALSAGLSPTI